MENTQDNNAGRQNRILYLDLLKLFAIGMIVICHSSTIKMDTVNIRSLEWQVMNLIESLTLWAIPALVMISGSLFLNKSVSVRKMYGKYIRRLFIALVFWSFVYAVITNIFGGNGSVKNFFKGFIQGHGHLWFLFMIIGLYMITPFLKRIVSDEKMLTYFLILSFLFAIAVPSCINILKLVRPDTGNWMETVVNQAYLKFPLGYSFYFAFGYYLNKTTISRKQSVIIYLCGIIGLFCTTVLTSIASISKGERILTFYDCLSLNVFFEALAVTVFFRNAYSNCSTGEKANMIISRLTKYSFGVYLVHILVMLVVQRVLHLDGKTISILAEMPVMSFSVLLISLVISAILNHIPIIRKYLV